MNKVILIGNLACDVELRTSQSGKYVASFRLAVQRRFPNQQGQREADFLPVIVFGNRAEMCAKYFSKGKKIALAGAIQTRNYTAQDGSKRYVTEIIAEDFEFVDSKQQSAGTSNDAQPQPQINNEQQEFQEVEDDELPF